MRARAQRVHGMLPVEHRRRRDDDQLGRFLRQHLRRVRVAANTIGHLSLPQALRIRVHNRRKLKALVLHDLRQVILPPDATQSDQRGFHVHSSYSPYTDYNRFFLR